MWGDQRLRLAALWTGHVTHAMISAKAVQMVSQRKSDEAPPPLPAHYIMRDHAGNVVYSCNLGAVRRSRKRG